MAAAGFVVIAFLFLWTGLGNRPDEGTNPDPKEGNRIVVLPFGSIGQPNDAYFADGLTEEITKDLVSLRELRVISRTSSLQYKRDRKPIPKIVKELGVDYVLEGTVRWSEWAGNRPRVRINSRLIRVADDTHLWAQSYERDVADIFKVQEEISRRVVEALGITLMPEANLALREQPTENVDAHRAYIRGLEIKDQPFYSEKDLRTAVLMFERAVKLDPGFAAAWAELSQVHSYLAFNTDRTLGRVEQAKHAMDRAVALAPSLPATRLAQAYFSYRCQGNFDAALAQLTAAALLYPNNAEILEPFGLVLRRKGRLTEAIEVLQRSSTLNPRVGELVWTIAETHRALREHEQADRGFVQAISLAPDVPFFWEQRALNRRAWTGNTKEARDILSEAPMTGAPQLEYVAFQLDLDERDYKRALGRLSSAAIKELPLQDQSRLAVLGVVARNRLGDHQGALVTAEANRVELKARVARFPQEPVFRAYLALTLAQLGQEDAAIAQARQAAGQSQHDAFSGPRVVEVQAMVDATLGRSREAIARLAGLLSASYRYSVCATELRLDPVWDPLRGEPSFDALLHGQNRPP